MKNTKFARGQQRTLLPSPASVPCTDQSADPLLGGADLRREVAKRFGFQPSKHMINRYILSGQLPAERFGKVWLVRRSVLIEFLNRRRQVSSSVARASGVGARERLLRDAKGGA